MATQTEGNDTPGNNTPTIRTATDADVALLASLGIRTFSETFADVNSAADMELYLQNNFNAAQVSRALNDRSNLFLIAWCGDQPAGYAKLRKSQAPPEVGSGRAIELERLYVAREFIGKLIGRLLMDTCIAIAVKQGYDTLWLGVWEHNDRAIAFYRKCGFEKVGAHPFVLGTDVQTDHLMKRSIR